MASEKQPKSYIKNLNEIETFVNEIIDSIKMMEQRNDPKIKEYLDISVNELASFLIKYEKDLDEDTQKKIAEIIKNIWDQYYQYVQSIYDKGMKGCSKRDFYFKQSPLKIRIRENLEKLVLQLDSTATIKCTGTNESALFYIDNMEKLLPILSNKERKHWIDYYRDIADDETLKKLDEIDKKYSGRNYIPWDCRVIGNTLKSIEKLLNLWENENIGGSAEKAYLRKCDEISQNFLELCNELQEKIKEYIEEHPALSRAEQRQLVGYLNKLWEFYKNAPLTLSSIEEKYINKGWAFGFIEDKRKDLIQIASTIQSKRTEMKLEIKKDSDYPFNQAKLVRTASNCETINEISGFNSTDSSNRIVSELFQNLGKCSDKDIKELYDFFRKKTAGNFYYIQAVTNNGVGYDSSISKNEKKKIIQKNFLEDYLKDLNHFLELHRPELHEKEFSEQILDDAKRNPNVFNESKIKSCTAVFANAVEGNNKARKKLK